MFKIIIIASISTFIGYYGCKILREESCECKQEQVDVFQDYDAYESDLYNILAKEPKEVE